MTGATRPAPLIVSLLLCALAGCPRGGAPATTPSTTTTPAVATTPATGDDATADAKPGCRDWSTLDRSRLSALPTAPHMTLFDQVWTAVLERHYDPTLGCLDWPALRERYGAQVAGAKDDAAAYAAMNAMLGELRQSHLGLVPPQRAMAAEPGQARPTGLGRVPIEITMAGDDVVVSSAAWLGKKSPVPAGATLLAIDDHALPQWVAQAGTQWSRPVERDLHVLMAARAWLSCDRGQSHELTWQAAGARKPSSKRVACHVPQRRTATFGNLAGVPIESQWRMLEPGVGYLSFNIWLLDLVGDIGKAMIELRGQGMRALVLDLRGNPGGIGAMVVPVARMLLDRDADLGVMRMRDATQTFAVKKGDDPFTGPIAILVDEGTASTSEIFAQALQDLGRATVVGARETQGAALPSLIEKLDEGALLQYVIADYKSPKGTAVEGRGVLPDVVVTVSRDDLRKGRDPVLQAAIAALSATTKPTTKESSP